MSQGGEAFDNPELAFEFYHAATKGDIERLGACLKAGVPIDYYQGPNQIRDPALHNALSLAAQNGHTDAVRYLLNRGANPNAPNPHYTSNQRYPIDRILQECADPGKEEIIHMLIDAGIKLDRRNTSYAFIPLIQLLSTAKFKDKAIARFPAWAKNRTAKTTPTGILNFLQAGRLDVVKLFHENGLLDFAEAQPGEPLLHSAVEGHQFEIAEYLLSVGAGINTKNSAGETALMHAAQVGDMGVVQWLIQHGADVNSVDDNNIPTAVYALSNEAMSDCLAAAGANFDPGGISPAGIKDFVTEWFLKDNSYAVGRFFGQYPMDRVSDIFKRHFENKTLLGAAVFRNAPRCCGALLDLGADINELDSAGRTALHVAVESNTLECAIFLVERGADVSVPNRAGVDFFKATRQSKAVSEQFKSAVRALEVKMKLEIQAKALSGARQGQHQ